MIEKKRVPEIRFRGFTDDWEQRKLGELGSVEMCKRIFKEQTHEHGDIPFYKIGTFGGTADAYITKELFEEYRFKYPYPEKGSILISASGSIGRTVVFTGKSEYFQDSNIVWLKHDERINDSFLKYTYSIIKWSGIEGSTIKRLYNNNILDTEIRLPSINEQIEIGLYLDKLDNLITLHQRELDLYKEMKKTLLNKMFAKNEEKFPEIRFKGFTEDWEQRKLGDIFVSLQNNTLSRTELSNKGDVMNIHYGDILVKFGEIVDVKFKELPMIVNSINLDRYVESFLHNGDIIIADTAEDNRVGKCIEITGLNEERVLSGLHTIPYRPLIKFASGYLGYFMNSKAYHNQLLPLMQGIKVTSISKSSLKDTVIKYPKSLFEQLKAAKILIELDNLITLHQRKIDALKDMKKTLLNKMFV